MGESEDAVATAQLLLLDILAMTSAAVEFSARPNVHFNVVES